MSEPLYTSYIKDESGNLIVTGYAYGKEWVSQALLMDDLSEEVKEKRVSVADLRRALRVEYDVEV